MSQARLTVLSNKDVINIEGYLANYDKSINLDGTNFKSDWLLSESIYDNKWILRTAKTIKLSDGSYKYTMSINWARPLADGTMLTDCINSEFKIFLQETLFLYRDSPSLSNLSSNTSFNSRSSYLFAFICWIFNPQLNINPRKYFFSRITQQHLNDFFTIYLTGGTFEIYGTANKVFSKITLETGATFKIDNALDLPDEYIATIIKYFSDNGMYVINNYGCQCIDRNKLIEYFNLSTHENYGHKSSLFFRQFEPEILERFPHVLAPVNLETELPGHTTPLIDEVLCSNFSEKTAFTILSFITSVLKLNKIYKNKFPNPYSIRHLECKSIINKYGSNTSLTPWIPLPICLKLINESIGFIIKYGDKVIDLYAETYKLLHNNNQLGLDRLSSSQKEYRDNTIIDITKQLNIDFDVKGFSVFEKKEIDNTYTKLRKSPSIDQLLSVLYGACFIIIAGLKPIRVNELSSLKYDCLFFKKNDGFWMEQEIEKAGIEDTRPTDAKPIPKIAANAIQLLQKLNRHALEFSSDSNSRESEYLLYRLLYSEKHRGNAAVMNQGFIRKCTQVFCDFIQVPPDDYGRRWYVNTHELRKSFLLTFFLTFKFSSLDACREIAGHKDPAHILRYIESEIPGEEMVEIEAEYAQQQLRLFSSNNSLSEINNIEEIYNDICNGFNVKSLSFIKDSELKEWLELCINSGRYRLHAYGINSNDSTISANIAVSVQEEIINARY